MLKFFFFFSDKRKYDTTMLLQNSRIDSNLVIRQY